MYFWSTSSTKIKRFRLRGGGDGDGDGDGDDGKVVGGGVSSKNNIFRTRLSGIIGDNVNGGGRGSVGIWLEKIGDGNGVGGNCFDCGDVDTDDGGCFDCGDVDTDGGGTGVGPPSK